MRRKAAKRATATSTPRASTSLRPRKVPARMGVPVVYSNGTPSTAPRDSQLRGRRELSLTVVSRTRTLTPTDARALQYSLTRLVAAIPWGRPRASPTTTTSSGASAGRTDGSRAGSAPDDHTAPGLPVCGGRPSAQLAPLIACIPICQSIAHCWSAWSNTIRGALSELTRSRETRATPARRHGWPRRRSRRRSRSLRPRPRA